jgi:hypothetical protein
VLLAVCAGAGELGAEVPAADELDDPDGEDKPGCVVADTCWTKGSLPAKVSKEYSCDFVRLGATSEFGSFVLVADMGSPVAAVPEAVAAGTAVAPEGVEPVVVVEAVVPAAVDELLLPPR